MPKRPKPEIMDYDPNIRFAKQKVKVTLGRWKYRESWTVEVGGNCKGFNIFDSAIEALNDIIIAACEGDDILSFELDSPEGSLQIEHEDEGDCDCDWLHQYVIAIEIVDIQKEAP